MQGRQDPNVELMDTQALVGHLVDEASVYGFLAEHRDRLFADELFADLFPSSTGRPSVPAPVAATVLVLQALEGRSDREAMDQLRCDIRWKTAAGLALDHEAFHPTTLTYWRTRIRHSERPHRLEEAVGAVLAETGVIKRLARRALDSTVLHDAVATQDTVTQLVAQIRRVRRLIPAAAEVAVSAHDYSLPGKPECDWRDAEARDALVAALVADALAILAAVEGLPLDEGQTQAVGLLALVAGQDVEEGEEEGSWRIARRTVEDRVVSTVDPDSRHVHKTRRAYVDGYKAHLAVEPDTGLVTASTLTAGNVHDGELASELLAGEPDPVEVVADAAYGAGRVRADLAAAGHTQTIKPIPLRASTDHPEAFTLDDFAIDLKARTATCPAGTTVPLSDGNYASFGTRCQDCPLRDRCTTARRGKQITLHPHHDQLATARRDAADPDWQHRYRQHRPMVERTIAWLVARGNRRVRFRGIERNRQWLSDRVAAVNLKRLLALGLDHDGTGWALPART